ncbi:MAG: hypothetical protein WBP61_03295, partial [Nocardioides sp.]
MAMRVAVCGLLSVVRDGAELTGPEIGTRKARLLVAVLAASRGATVPADRLAQVLWGEQQPRDPHANLATLASRLRRSLGDGVLSGTGSGYALAAPVVLDLDDARDLVADARLRLDRREPALAVAAASGALSALGADDALAEECMGAWAADLARDAADLRREARHVLALAAAATGEHDLA